MLASLLYPALRLYFRSVPIKTGKLWVWNTLMRPYIIWRPAELEAETATGLRLRNTMSDVIHSALYFLGVWEPALTQYIARHLRPGDIYIDIGANVGVHAMHGAQRVGATGRVHAIEASPTIFGLLQSNIARNGLSNITAHNVAVSDHHGTLTVYLHGSGNLGLTTILQAVDTTSAQEETIEARPLAGIVPEADILNARLIKIDVEGAEWQVLQGMAALIPRLHEDVSLVVEVSRDALASHGISIAQFMSFFESHGYGATRLADHSAALCISGADAPPLPVPVDFEMADLVFRRRR
jgi:FkbM family methyltransferase